MGRLSDLAESDHTKADPLHLVDFCKGVAILGIVLVHARHNWFGWQGAHLFIVLSGFGLSYAAMQGQSCNWRAWYARRAMRILPAYWLVVVSGVALVVGLRALGMETSVSVPTVLSRLPLDLALLRNFSYQAMLADPNSALWYTPLIAGFYLIFPWLYQRVVACRTARDYVYLLLAAVVAECACRALAIYALDGVPVAYGHGFLPGLRPAVAPLDRLPAAFPLQLWAPFGLFPTRIGEFVLGMVAAAGLRRQRPRLTTALFSPAALAAGVALWLLGSLLVYAGRWGWVVADLAIAAGLMLVTLRLAAAAKHGLPWAFALVSQLGAWSYYIFLTHLLVGYAYAATYPYLGAPALQVGMLGAVVAAIGLASWLLMRFDHLLVGRRLER